MDKLDRVVCPNFSTARGRFSTQKNGVIFHDDGRKLYLTSKKRVGPIDDTEQKSELYFGDGFLLAVFRIVDLQDRSLPELSS